MTKYLEDNNFRPLVIVVNNARTRHVIWNIVKLRLFLRKKEVTANEIMLHYDSRWLSSLTIYFRGTLSLMSSQRWKLEGKGRILILPHQLFR